MKNLVKKVILLSFGLMVYGGLRGYELLSDYSMMVFVGSIIALVFVKE